MVVETVGSRRPHTITDTEVALAAHDDIVLAALAPTDARPHSPVQVQKLLFLLDREVRHLVGRHFEFIPYHYGPFDPRVYAVLEGLDRQGLGLDPASRSSVASATVGVLRRRKHAAAAGPTGGSHGVRS